MKQRKQLLNSLGLSSPHLSQHLLRLLLLLVTAIGGVGSSWAEDVVLFETDFTATDGWTTEDIITESQTTATRTIKGTKISFKGYKTTPLKLDASVGTLTFTSNNITDKTNVSELNYYMAIPLTGVNGSITIEYGGDKMTHNYTYSDGSTASVLSRMSGGNVNDKKWTIDGLTNSNVTLYLGTSGKTISSLKITTPESDGTYTLTYNTNGGTQTEPTEVTEQTALPATFPIPTKAGNVFGGWYTDAEFTSLAVKNAVISKNTTLYAKWTEYNYSTNASDLVEIPIGTTIKLIDFVPNVGKADAENKVTANGFIEANTVFANNYLQYQATGGLNVKNAKSYSDGNVFIPAIDIKDNRKLIFKLPAGCKLTVYGNNPGSDTRTWDLQKGSEAIISEQQADYFKCDITEEGTYTLLTHGSNATLQLAAIKVTPTIEPYTVSFNAGMSGACTTTELTEEVAGAGVTLPKATVNDGYKFVGWSTNSNPTSADAGKANDNFEPTSNCTLYAYYEALLPATITVTGAGTYNLGDAITLRGTATPTNGGAIYSVSGVNNGQVYRWKTCYADGSNLKDIGGATHADFTPSITTPGTYYYKFMCVENVDGTSGYKTTYSDIVTVTVLGTPTITSTPADSPVQMEWGETIEITLNSNSQGAFTASVTDGTPLNVSVDGNKLTITSTGRATTTYTVTVNQEANGIYTAGSLNVSVQIKKKDMAAPMISCVGNKVTITPSVSGSTIYYTTNGSEPTSASDVYSTPFDITENTTIKAYATANDYNDSPIATQDVTYVETSVNVGSDNTTAYGTISPVYSIEKGKTRRVTFINHNDPTKNNWNNWYLWVGDNTITSESGANILRMRSDNWDDDGETHSDKANTFNWGTFKNEMNGATIVMDITNAGNHVYVNTTITSTGGTSYKYSMISKNITEFGIANFCFTVNESWIENIVVSDAVPAYKLSYVTRNTERNGQSDEFDSKYGIVTIKNAQGLPLRDGTYVPLNEVVTYKATANTGYEFTGWGSGYTQAERNITVAGGSINEGVVCPCADFVDARLLVTYNKQEYILTTANASIDPFFTHGATNKGKYSIEGNDVEIYRIKNSNGSDAVSVKVKGAKAVAALVYNNGGGARNFKVAIDGVDKGTESAAKGSLTTSNIYKIDNENATITLKGTGTDLYAYKLIFYTEVPSVISVKKENVNYNNVDMFVDAAAETFTVSSINTGTNIGIGDITEVSEYATIDFTQGTGALIITPKKAGSGVIKFTQAASGDFVAGEKEFLLTISKHAIELAYSAESYTKTITKSGENEDGNLTPTLSAKVDGGNSSVTPASLGITISYISDDPSVANVSADGAITLASGDINGSANIYAVFNGSDIYLPAKAEFSVSVFEGYPVKLTTKIPNVNDRYVAMDEDEKVLCTMIFGGYKYNSANLFGSTDSWDQSTSEVDNGSGGKKKVLNAYKGQGGYTNQMDGFILQAQAKQDARHEYNGKLEWYDNNYNRIKPFSLPVRGAYLKFEPEVNGTLTAYVLQNGNITFSDVEGHSDEPAATPLGGNPRVYYWFNQDGQRITPDLYVSKQPLMIGRDYNTKLAGMINDWYTPYPELQTLFETDGKWPTQAEVNANLAKALPDPQSVVEYQKGYMVAQKAYVKYVLKVVAGNTYYFFSNNSKVGAAGFNFVPSEAENQRMELVKPEGGDLVATVSSTPVELAQNDNAISKMKPSSDAINGYETVTLNRTFNVNTWNTICLPFHVNETQVEKVFGKGTKLMIYNGLQGTKAHFLQHVDQNILAGQPYFIYPTGVDAEDVSTGTDPKVGGVTGKITFHNVCVDPTLAVQSYGNDQYGTRVAGESWTPVEEGTHFNFIGTLAQENVVKDSYYVNAKTGELTLYTGNGTTLNTYRAYLKPTSPSGAKITGVSFSGVEDNFEDATGIEEILVNDYGFEIEPVEGVFNLSGQKVAESTKNLPAGVYVVNGKKMVIK